MSLFLSNRGVVSALKASSSFKMLDNSDEIFDIVSGSILSRVFDGEWSSPVSMLSYVSISEYLSDPLSFFDRSSVS